MRHADEEALLTGIGEELHVGGAAVVADHREAGDAVPISLPVDDVHEAPVHLVCLAGRRDEPLGAPSPGRRRLSLRGDEVPVPGDVDLHRGEAAFVPLLDEPVEDYLRVGDAPFEKVVDKAGVAGEHRGPTPGARVAVRLDLEAVGLERPGPLPGKARPAAELGEVALLRVEASDSLFGHRFERLVYNLLQAIVGVFHCILPPIAGVSATPA